MVVHADIVARNYKGKCVQRMDKCCKMAAFSLLIGPKKKQTRKQESDRDSGRNDFSVSAPEGGWKAGDEFQIRSNSSL